MCINRTVFKSSEDYLVDLTLLFFDFNDFFKFHLGFIQNLFVMFRIVWNSLWIMRDHLFIIIFFWITRIISRLSTFFNMFQIFGVFFQDSLIYSLNSLGISLALLMDSFTDSQYKFWIAMKSIRLSDYWMVHFPNKYKKKHHFKCKFSRKHLYISFGF